MEKLRAPDRGRSHEGLASHISTPCIEWAGYKDRGGYGRFKVNCKHVQAHRAAWELDCGPIPDGMVIDHLCRNPSCINTDHMEVVSRRENTLRGISPVARCARKTHCKHGHPFDENNTHVEKDGHRKCRTCQRAVDRRRYAADRQRYAARKKAERTRAAIDCAKQEGKA